MKAIRAENMSHLENLEIVCALLEDHNPDVLVLGVDYQSKMEQLRLEGEELEIKQKEIEEKEELLRRQELALPQRLIVNKPT